MMKTRLCRTARLIAGPRLILLCVFGVICFLPAVSYAGWLSWLGAVLTVAAVAAVVVSPNAAGAAAAVVLGIGQVFAIVVDQIVIPMIPPPPPAKPPAAMLPKPPLYMSSDDSYEDATYPSLALQGNAGDPVRIAGNSMISAMNTLLADVRAGASPPTLAQDTTRLGTTFNTIAASLSTSGVAFSITQGDIDSVQADIATSGLPEFEISYLQSAGVSAANIGSLGTYVADTPINLAVPSLTVNDLLHQTAGSLGVPEPDSILLLSIGVIGLGTLRRPKSVKSVSVAAG